MNGLAHRFLGISLMLPLLAVGAPAMADFKGFTTSSPLFGDQTVGNASIVVRTVTGTVEDDTRILNLQDDVYHNELIATEEESAAEITFIDETTISLGANANIVLDQFVYDPEPSNSSFVITVTEGALRFTSGVMPSEAYEIRTPVATIGIRGTIIDVLVDHGLGSDGTPYTSVNLSVENGEATLIDCAGEVTLVPASSSSTIMGSAGGCSKAIDLRPVDVTQLNR